MGKTAKPLTIIALPPVSGWNTELDKLEKQGHTVVRLEPIPQGFRSNVPNEDALSLLVDADVVLGGRCWLMDHKHRKHLTGALKQARLRKYEDLAKKGDPASDLDVGEPGTGE